MTISDRTILDYDASGFIMGIDRINKGIDNVSDNTDEIIQILKAQRQVNDTRMTELARAVRAIEHQISTQNSINNNRKRSSESGGTRRVLPPSNDTSSNNRISSNAPIHRQRSADGSLGAGSNAEAGNRVTNNRSRITSDVGVSNHLKVTPIALKGAVIAMLIVSVTLTVGSLVVVVLSQAQQTVLSVTL